MKLEANHLSLLRKGMKFTPNTEGRANTFFGDITSFTRQLQIKEIFHESQYINPSVVKNKSTKPLTSKNPELNQMISLKLKTLDQRRHPQTIIYRKRKAPHSQT